MWRCEKFFFWASYGNFSANVNFFTINFWKKIIFRLLLLILLIHKNFSLEVDSYSFTQLANSIVHILSKQSRNKHQVAMYYCISKNHSTILLFIYIHRKRRAAKRWTRRTEFIENRNVYASIVVNYAQNIAAHWKNTQKRWMCEICSQKEEKIPT